jgi:hypothetical protein
MTAQPPLETSPDISQAKPVEAPSSTVFSDIMSQVNSAFAQPAPVATPAKPAEPEKPKPAPAATTPAPKVEQKGIPDPTAADSPAATEPAKADDQDDTPADLPESAKPNWKAIRQTARQAREEAAALKKQLEQREAEFKTAQEWTKEREQLAKQNEELSARLQAVAIERHPKFQAYFGEREKVLVGQAKKIAGERGEHLAAILSMPEGVAKNSALNEVLTDLDTVQQSRIGGIVNALEALSLEKQGELAKASETFKLMQQQQSEQSRKVAEQAKGAFENVLNKWSDPKNGFAVLQTRPDDPEWNARVEQTKSLSRSIFLGENMSLEDKAKASLWAGAGPALLQEVKVLQSQKAALEADLAKLKVAQPSSGSASVPATEDVDDKLPLHQRIVKMAVNNGAFGR